MDWVVFVKLGLGLVPLVGVDSVVGVVRWSIAVVINRRRRRRRRKHILRSLLLLLLVFLTLLLLFGLD